MFKAMFDVRILPVLAALSVLAACSVVTAQHSGHAMPASPQAAAKASPNRTPLPLQVVGKATVVAVPPGIKETSAFISLKNTGKQTVKLLSVSASVAGNAMYMNTVKSQNMMGMVQAPGFSIAPGGTLRMANDGNHVMLMRLKRPLKVGEVLPIVLQAADGRTLTVKATVTKP